jgi:hypothetical protein
MTKPSLRTSSPRAIARQPNLYAGRIVLGERHAAHPSTRHVGAGGERPHRHGDVVVRVDARRPSARRSKAPAAGGAVSSWRPS